MRRTNRTEIAFLQERMRGEVAIRGETVTYTLCEFDGRREKQREENARRQALDGDLNVYLPGHGQPPDAARNLLETIVSLSRSKVLWSLSIDAVTGGDTVRSEALEKVIERRVRQKSLMEADQGSEKSSSLGVTLFGWSHGALVALLAAERNSCLFPRVVCFCPAGLVERSPGETVLSYLMGSTVSFWKALLRRDGTATRLLERGRNVRAAAAHDLVRGGSFQRVLEEIRSASRKVVGKGYRYDGQVVLLFGEDDAVIRWRDLFPSCEYSSQVEQFLAEYKRNNFPEVRVLRVSILDGDHAAPELQAPLYVGTAFDLIGLARKPQPNAWVSRSGFGR